MRYVSAAVLMVGLVASGTIACERQPNDDATIEESAREPAEAPAEPGSSVGDQATAALETVDVKTALMTDDLVEAGDINVDTDAANKVVVLKGSVPDAAQRERAELVAAKEAPGFRIDNQLVVAAR